MVKVIVSFYYMGENSPVLAILDLKDKSVIAEITYNRIGKVTQIKDGIRGVTYWQKVLYFASQTNLFKSDFLLNNIERLPCTGRDIHQIDYVPDMGLLYCSTGENSIKLFDISTKQEYFILTGYGGLERDSNHINSIYQADKLFYVAHNGCSGNECGSVMTDRGEILVTGMDRPHNVCIINDRIFTLDSGHFRLRVCDFDGNEIQSCNAGGFTKGLAVTQELIYLGVAIREAPQSFICILDHNLKLVDKINFFDIDERFSGHPYDIRIWDGIDYGMSQYYKNELSK